MPNILNFNKARFIPISDSLFMAILATSTITQLAKISGKFKNIVLLFLLTIFTVLTIPTYYMQISYFINPSINQLDIYLPVDAFRMFEKARDVSHESDVFLISWPYQLSFPALMGRKTYWGDPLMTIRSQEKEKEAVQFFYLPDISNEYRAEFLINNGINYVLEYPGHDTLKNLGLLEKIDSNSQATLYKVSIPPVSHQ